MVRRLMGEPLQPLCSLGMNRENIVFVFPQKQLALLVCEDDTNGCFLSPILYSNHRKRVLIVTLYLRVHFSRTIFGM